MLGILSSLLFKSALLTFLTRHGQLKDNPT